MLETLFGIVIKADETRHHLDAVGVDSPDRGQNVLVQVLGLEVSFRLAGSVDSMR